MQKLQDFYTDQLNRYLEDYASVKKKLRLLLISRIVVFIVVLLLIYFNRADVNMAIGFSVVGLALFLFLVRYYEDTQAKYRFLNALVKINETELRVLQHDFSDLPDGSEFLDSQHEFSHDLDLFGQGSFFQYLNRTQLPEGTEKLAGLFMANDIESIGAKQESIDELAQVPEWRQHFSAHASLIERQASIEEVVKWLKGYTPFVPKFMRYVPWIFLAGFLVLGILTFWLDWSSIYLLFYLTAGLGITGRFYKKIMGLTQVADRVKSVFEQYSKLLEIIEDTDFKAPQLRFQKQRLQMAEKKASSAIASFSRLLNTMDYNNNIFYAIFGNGCFLGALWTAFLIEDWIGRNKAEVGEWFDVIAFFDANNSLGNFSFNHPLFSYPALTGGPEVLYCKKLGHPLIPAKNNVKNDFRIVDKNFFIITGSNMAGKSTFLRSVGLCMVMANLGLPVYADDCVYSPCKLITSMRSTDSLHKVDSYFFSELKRLKMVVQAVENDIYFVLLDEILKGTNSTDKAVGSRKFLSRLVRAKTTGIIATHDLSLCEAANEYQNVANYHLDATIENDELSFDYLLKEGVSKTMNASFLLRKMDLI